MPTLTGSIAAEFKRYQTLAEGAVAQIGDDEICRPGPNGSSSIAVIVWHIAGNLESRFTNFRTTDGEKPWRNRDAEFEERTVTRDQLMARWQAGWDPLTTALASLTDADLNDTVTIRGEAHTVYQALHRLLAHTAYHVGQIVYVAKEFRGDAWNSLSIPKGGSAAFNARLMSSKSST